MLFFDPFFASLFRSVTGTAAASTAFFGYIKIEDSPEPEVLGAEPTTLPVKLPAPIKTRDPENFLKRCSGLSKKTNHRCGVVIGKKSQKDAHPTFLPTCSSHRDQQSLAGWCQFMCSDGERCGRLFRWRPYVAFTCEPCMEDVLTTYLRL